MVSADESQQSSHNAASIAHRLAIGVLAFQFLRQYAAACSALSQEKQILNRAG